MTVRVGQVWGYSDPRLSGSWLLRVERVDAEHAHCRVLTKANGAVDGHRRVRVLLDRFRSAGAEYRLREPV